VVPTGPKGETTPFCHLRLDYLNLAARFVIAIERERVQIDIRAKEYGTPVALGVDYEHHMEIALELDMVNDLMIQHDVIVFGIH
jgi:hypothetical protein